MQSDTTGSLQEFHKILEEARKRSFRYPLCAERAAAAPDRWKACGYDRGMERVFFHGGTHREIAGQKQQKTFEENGEVEFSCPVFNKRVRVNLFRQSGTCAMSVRLFAEKIPTPQMLGLPESAVQMAGKRRGLILVTGASGSGRTTTMASMIDHIASNYERSILTLENRQSIFSGAESPWCCSGRSALTPGLMKRV